MHNYIYVHIRRSAQAMHYYYQHQLAIMAILDLHSASCYLLLVSLPNKLCIAISQPPARLLLVPKVIILVARKCTLVPIWAPQRQLDSPDIVSFLTHYLHGNNQVLLSWMRMVHIYIDNTCSTNYTMVWASEFAQQGYFKSFPIAGHTKFGPYLYSKLDF